MLDRFADEFVSVCPPLLRGQPGQIANLDRVAIDTVVGARTGVISQVRTDGQVTKVDCYGRRITFPAHAAAGVKFVLRKPKVCGL
jgi:hypothetical protein